MGTRHMSYRGPVQKEVDLLLFTIDGNAVYTLSGFLHVLQNIWLKGALALGRLPNMVKY